MLGCKRWARTLLATLVPLAAMGVLAAVAVAGRVPGTTVALEPPPGFSVATQFPGYQQAATGSSIVVTELPGPVSELTAAMTAEGMATQGMRLIDSTEATAAGRKARLFHAAQTVSGVEFEKWMLAFGERDRTVLVIGSFPKEAAESLREPVRAALLSVQWSPRLEAIRTEGLPFAISQTSELKISQRIGNTLLLTREGAAGSVDPAAPLLVVGTSISEIAITDVEDFARDRVKRTAQITDLSGVAGEALKIAGLPAYELRAEARDEKTGTPLRVYQLIVADAKRYFLVTGLVGSAQAERFLPQFREVGRSLRRIK